MASRTVLAPEEIDRFQQIRGRDLYYAKRLIELYVREGATYAYLQDVLGIPTRRLYEYRASLPRLL